MANQASILLFHTTPSKTKQIEFLCRTLRIRVIKVKSSSYGQTLGYLAGITGFSRIPTTYTGPEFPSEMMVFSGLDSDRLDIFLAEYKKASIPPIGLKAILTPHNVNWSAEKLYRELFQEHTSLHFPK